MAYATILVYFMWCSDSCPHEWDMAVPLSLYLFCEDSDGAAHLLVCLICRWLPAVSGTWRMPLSQNVVHVFSRRWLPPFPRLALTKSEVVACTSGTWR